MSTHAKLFAFAAVALALGLLIGFFPIHAGAADCGSAIITTDYIGYAGEVCDGKVSMMRYLAVVLGVAGIISGVIGLFAHANSEEWTPIR